MKTSYSPQKTKPSFCSYLLVLLTIILWLIGCSLIGYIAWVLATSVTLSRFLSGNLLFTYVIISLGFYLFFTGFLGCVGTISQSSCLVKLYILVAVLCIASQIGGILTLVIMKIQVNEIIQSGWREINPATRNILQSQLDCCGLEGPKEFAYRNDVIHPSCYIIPPRTTVAPLVDTYGNTTYVVAQRNVTRDLSGLRLKQDGCGPKLKEWLGNNKLIWIPISSSLGLLEIFSIIASVYVISHVNKSRRQMSLELMEKSQFHHGY